MADEKEAVEASKRSVLVGEFMTKEVVSLTPEQELQSAVKTLMERHIKGAPVVDSEGVLLGVLTEDDLLAGNSRLHIPTMISILGEMTAWPPSILKFNHHRIGTICRPGNHALAVPRCPQAASKFSVNENHLAT